MKRAFDALTLSAAFAFGATVYPTPARWLHWVWLGAFGVGSFGRTWCR